MRVHVDIPSDKVSEALTNENKRLKRENTKLKSRVDQLTRQIAQANGDRLATSLMLKEFKTLCDKWADHEGCE